MIIGMKRSTAGAIAVASIVIASGGPSAALHTASVSAAAPATKQCATNEAAVVQSVTARLEVKHARGAWRAAQSRMPLKAGDQIRTGATGRAALLLCDGGSLYINRHSVAQLRSRGTTVLRAGEVDVVLGAGNSHRVATASMSTQPANALETNLDVRTQRGVAYVTLLAGASQVKNNRGSVTVAAGSRTTVAADRAPGPPQVVDAPAVTSWTNGYRWRVLSRAGQLHQPERLTVDGQGNVYVADTGNSRVVKISSVGKQLAAWGSKGSGSGKFDQPIGIGLDPAGNIYVVDDNIEQPQIAKLSPSGQEIARFVPYGPDPGHVEFGTALAIDKQGNMYVTDTYPGTARVQKLSPSGEPLGSWGFVNPIGVGLDLSGNIYVVDQDSTHNIYDVVELDPTGAPLSHWGGATGKAPGKFASATDVAVDSRGNIYVADAGNNRIQELAPSGHVLAVWGTKGAGVGQFDDPEGVAVDSQGNLYVAEKGNSRVQRYSSGA